METEQFIVEHRPAEKEFVLVNTETNERAGEISYVEVTPEGGQQPGERVLFHTGVDEAYSGRGLAGKLAREAVEQTIAQGLRVVPVCPYIKGWLPKHPEYAEAVTEATAAHIAAVKALG